MECLMCGRALKGKKRRYCSTTCMQVKHALERESKNSYDNDAEIIVKYYM